MSNATSLRRRMIISDLHCASAAIQRAFVAAAAAGDLDLAKECREANKRVGELISRVSRAESPAPLPTLRDLVVS